jgi:hypothetical protein
MKKIDPWTWYERKYLLFRDMPEAMHHLMRTWTLLFAISLFAMIVSLISLGLILLH